MSIVQYKQHSRRRWVACIAGLALCLLFAIFGYRYWLSATRNKVAVAGAETTAPLFARPQASVAGPRTNPGNAAKQSSDARDTQSAAIAALLGSNPKKWNEVQRNYLSRLDLADMWDVLMTSGVAEQTPAKELRDSLLFGCGKYIQSADERSSPQEEVSLLKTQCTTLLSRGDKQYFRDRSVDLLADDAFQATESRAPGPDYAHLRERPIRNSKLSNSLA